MSYKAWQVYDTCLFLAACCCTGAALGGFTTHHAANAIPFGFAALVGFYCSRRLWR